MREIKFRAWDKVNKKMLYQSGWTGKPQFFVFDKDVWGVPELLKGQIVNLLTTVLEIKEGLIPLEYTGLKDKNGKEIYEGDIINISCNQTRNVIAEKKMVVNYAEDTYAYFSLIEIEKWGKDNGSYYSHLNTWYKPEVVGNIYENPELLKGENRCQ